jgi:glycosyltransferase involved in cell wall biosynthesis
MARHTGESSSDLDNGRASGLPLVSIVTPVLNGVRFIEACIESVLGQNYPEVEHIFVDGGSSDGTVEVLSRYEGQCPYKVRVALEPDSAAHVNGPGEAWNKALDMANGQIVGWLGSDDMLHGPGSIQTVVDFFREHPDACFVHGGCNYINEEGGIIFTHRPKEFTLDELINDRNSVAFPSAFYRRHVIDTIGKLDAYGNDFDFVIRIAKRFPVHRVDAVLSNFRVHDDSETGSPQRYRRVQRLDYAVARRHGGRLFSHRSMRYYLTVVTDWLPGPVSSFLWRVARRISSRG